MFRFRPPKWLFTTTVTDDPLAPHRIRATYLFAIVALVFLSPFTVINYLQGHRTLAVMIGGIVVALAIQAVVIHRGRPPPIPNLVFLLAAVAGIAFATKTLGIIAAFWAFPCVLFVYFVVPRRKANLWNLLLITAITAAAYRYAGSAAALRFAATLLLTMVVTHIILNVIHDLQRRLTELAVTDPLTGAFNRRQLDTRLDEAMERDRRKPTPAALLVIDIDHFKRINDQFGHKTGDTVLKDVVALIGARSRKLDTLFRIGGEEFLLLLSDTSETIAAHVAEQLRLAIAEHPLLPDISVTVSIGVSGLRANDSVDSWIKRADEALYAAKNAGRNRVVVAEFARPAAGRARI